MDPKPTKSGGEEEQLALFTAEDIDDMQNLAPEFQVLARKHSAEFLKRDNPRLYKALVLAIKLGISDREIADTCEVSTNLVAAIRSGPDAKISVEAYKKRAMAGLQRLALGCITRMQEMIDGGADIPFQALAVAHGIAVEKHAILNGEATQKVEHSLSPREEAWRQALLEARSIDPAAGNLAANASAQPVEPVTSKIVDVAGHIVCPDNSSEPTENHQP
jgi:hypothetical protein